jgi:hypothetical protein
MARLSLFQDRGQQKKFSDFTLFPAFSAAKL